VVSVPLLEDGAGLEEGPLSPECTAGHIPISPEQAPLVGSDAVAVLVTAANGARVASALRPGDIAILDRRWSGLIPNRIYAVRHRGTIALARCLLKGRSLLLLSDDPSGATGSGEVVVLAVRTEADLRRLVAGRVALSVRVWT
jgi:hypothetical protein